MIFEQTEYLEFETKFTNTLTLYDLGERISSV